MRYIYLILVILLIIFICKNQKLFFTQVKKENFSNDEIDIYLINMKKNKNRLDHFIDLYNNSDLKNIKLNIFPAIVGKDLDLVKYVTPKTYKQIISTEASFKRNTHYELSRGAVGCYLSHLNIYKQIMESDKKYGLIFEDDVTFKPDFYHNLSQSILNIPDDWDILLCGVFCLDCDNLNGYSLIRKFWGLHAYIVKKESAKKIYNELNKPIGRQIDGDMEFLNKINKIKIYALNPEIASQVSVFGSDIQTPVIPDKGIDPFTEN
jgi:GR25 family glycosyltransferase involved in LPS biosynthesis